MKLSELKAQVSTGRASEKERGQDLVEPIHTKLIDEVGGARKVPVPIWGQWNMSF